MYDIAQTVVTDLQNACDLSLKREGKQAADKLAIIDFLLCGGDECYEHITGHFGTANEQMAKYALMIAFMVIRNVVFFGVFSHAGKDCGVIGMYDLTALRIDDIMKASFFVQTERQWTVFNGISKGKFHFVTVSPLSVLSIFSYR